MKLSIIVPVYNVEPYLRRCIDSILAQTFTDFELILVDDGSPDNCPAICDEYAEKDSRIVVIHKQNGGLSDARNAGLDIARGEYIGFVDSDDFIHPQMYECLINAQAKSNADIVICNSIFVDEEGHPLNHSFSPLSDSPSSGMEILNTYKDDVSINVHYIVVWNKIYERSLWSNIRFPLGKINEDEYVFHHIIGGAKKVVSVSDQLYYYRQTPGSIMNKHYDIRRFDAFGAFADRIKFFLSHKLNDEAVTLLSYYYETLRLKYFSIPKNDETKAKLLEVRKTARKHLFTYLLKCHDIGTVKIATLIFMYFPSVYKRIWYKN